MTAAELVARIPGTRRTSNGWAARCPAHDDQNASLGIAEGRDGRVLLTCRAGCSFHAVTAALGLKPADLFPPRHTTAKHGERRIVAEYDYRDADGNPLFQVVRYEPKDFRQRRRNPDEPGVWTWNMKGVERVLYRLPEVNRAKTEGRAVFVAEGEKDCDALTALGLCATCNPGGAGKWQPSFTETLTGAKVIVLPDRDKAGRRHAALVLRELTGKAKSVRVVELPDRDGRHVKDAADWIAAGGTVEELREIVRNAPTWQPPEESDEQSTAPDAGKPDGKPVVLLPAGKQSISAAGRALGELLAATEHFFVRGGTVVRLGQDPDGVPQLEDVKAASLASDFEAVAELRKTDKEGGTVATTCPKQTAELIAASAAFRVAMPPINVLTRCPVVIERTGSLIQVAGYDRASGIMAAGEPAEPMDVAEARRLLCEILSGFRFATPADRARALAALVTPAMVFGGLLKGRAPVDLGEADASQTGKGYRNKLTAAVYAQSVKTVAQRRAGTGSLEESFDMALIRGANFIALDNVRGKIDSPRFESFLTEDTYHARGFHCEADIDPRRVVVMLTSNKADLTTDLANRCACVRLLKQPADHAFAVFPEGDILDHVRANQARYLGAVFAIVRAWHEAGKPRTTETRHDFRPWAQALDWITRNLLDAGPLLDGHRETQGRMTNPVLNWLRDVALEVIRARQAGAWLRTGHLVELLSDTGMETPGLDEHADLTNPETRKAAQQATGRRLGVCFKAGESLTLDGMTIERRESWDATERFTVKEYRFTPAASHAGSIAAESLTPSAAQSELALCGYCAASPAAMESAKETHAAANAADTSCKGEKSAREDQEHVNVVSTDTLSRIAATPAPMTAAIEEGEL